MEAVLEKKSFATLFDDGVRKVALGLDHRRRIYTGYLLLKRGP